MEPIILSPEVKQDLYGVVELMERNIDHIDMYGWLSTNDAEYAERTGAACGTVGCISGYINLYHGFDEKFYNQHFSDFALLSEIDHPVIVSGIKEGLIESRDYADFPQMSAVLMKQPAKNVFNTLGRLFYVEEWPSAFADKYEKTSDSGALEGAEKRTALGRITIDRLKHFIETGF